MPTYPTRAQPYTTKGEMRALLEQAQTQLRDYRDLIKTDFPLWAARTDKTLDPLLDDIEDALQRAPRRSVGRPRGH